MPGWRLTAGNAADIAMGGPLLDVADRVRCLIADKGYDANALRRRLYAEGAQAVMAGRSTRKVPTDCDPIRCRRAACATLLHSSRRTD
jgi:IS5 family transposase